MLRLSRSLLFSAAFLTTAVANAYTLRATPDGAAIRWSTDAVDILVEDSLDAIDPAAFEAVVGAFDAWSEIDEAYTPAITVRRGGVDAIGYRPGEANSNTVRFAPEGSSWAASALAVTVLTFDEQGGILDADIIVNGGAERPFAVVDETAPPGADDSASGPYDLQNVLTHEVGHLFGLGEETHNEEATMFFTSRRVETKKRDLDTDDAAGIQALYASAPEPQQVASCGIHGARLMMGSGWKACGLVAFGVALLAVRRLTARSEGAGGKRNRRQVFTAALDGASGLVVAAALALPQAPAAPPAESQGETAAMARVESRASRWSDGVIVTSLRLGLSPPGAPAAEVVSLEVLGGTVDGITQVVGHAPVPQLGAEIPVRIRAGGDVRAERLVALRQR